MAALSAFSALGQFLPRPARCPIKFLGGRKIVDVLEVANMGKNAVAAAQYDANLQQRRYLAF